MSTWSRVETWILDHPRPILGLTVALTLLLGFWTTRLQTDHQAGNFVASDAQVRQDFDRASRIFGRSETILYVVFQEVDPHDPAFLATLDTLGRRIAEHEGVQNVLSLANVPYLTRRGGDLEPVRLFDPALPADSLRARIAAQPFLKGLLLSPDGGTSLMMVRLEHAFNASAARVHLVDRIERWAEALPGEAAFAGFPYLRTQYAKRVTAEAPLFTVLALLVSLFFLFLTFRAWRTVILPTTIVVLGITWTFGLIALFDHRLNIVTAVLPALLVIIGMANAIHFTTKFYDQYALYGDRRLAVEHMLRTVGLATLLTSLTTAIGFAVLVFSGSHLLVAFGLFAAAGVMILYGLAMTLIPLSYLRLPPPSEAANALATHDRFADFFDGLAGVTRRHSAAFLLATGAVAAVALLGVSKISSDLYVFADFDARDPLRRDLSAFEEHYGGVLPMEVVIESETEGRFRSLGQVRRIESLQRGLSELEPVGGVFSAADLVKLANQAYFGGHPATYRLPSGYELPFLQGALEQLSDGAGRLTRNLPLFVDSSFTVTRLYVGVEDIGTTRMNALVDTVKARATALFPEDDYRVYVTGTAIMSTRSGETLVTNLVVSLGVALLLISALMALLFRSARLTVISLAPNLLPLLLVGGAMGFLGVPLKPSTALIFSLAFGIAVDDTIHFLSKYRLLRNGGTGREAAVRMTLRETGKAILFTSLILMSGFLVFTLSSFGGTVNMGALTAFTLAVALLSNLLLLPALLFRYAPEEHRPFTSSVQPG